MSRDLLDSSFLLPMTHGFWKSVGSRGLSFGSFNWSSRMTEPWAVMTLATRSSRYDSTRSRFSSRSALVRGYNSRALRIRRSSWVTARTVEPSSRAARTSKSSTN